MCICIILAVVCAGNMIPNYLISLKAAKTVSYTHLDVYKRQTPHIAFFTDQAVSDMVESSVKSVVQFAAGEDTPLEVH